MNKTFRAKGTFPRTDFWTIADCPATTMGFPSISLATNGRRALIPRIGLFIEQTRSIPMKQFVLPALVFIFSSFVSSAQEIDKLPLITVFGKAEIQIEPDEAVFTIDVTKSNKDLQTAKRTNDESVKKILELARRFSIAPQSIKTTYISVETKYESIRDTKTKIFNDDGEEIGKRIFRGYEVSKTVIARLTDISRFEEFFDEVLKTGLSEVRSITFETSKLRENRDKARELAMKAAKEKATAMAAALGQTIVKAVKIIEANSGDQSFRSYKETANSLGTTGSFTESLATFAAGAIKVEAQVTVSFGLN
jgi:uncharacterized protein